MNDHFDISYTKTYRSVFNVKIELKIVSASSAWVCSDFELDLYIENGTVIFLIRYVKMIMHWFWSRWRSRFEKFDPRITLSSNFRSGGTALPCRLRQYPTPSRSRVLHGLHPQTQVPQENACNIWVNFALYFVLFARESNRERGDNLFPRGALIGGMQGWRGGWHLSPCEALYFSQLQVRSYPCRHSRHIFFLIRV